MNRHVFMAMTGAAGLAASSEVVPRPGVAAATGVSEATADYTVRIAATTVEVAPGHEIRTTAYGGTVPGPPLRMHEGQQVTVDVHNDTDAEDVIHWHGQIVPPSVDGVIELGTPAVSAHGRRRYRFTPRPAGTRWYHSHVDMGPNADRGTFSGEFGFVLVEPRKDPGRYDREVLLALHEWEGQLVDGRGHDSLNAPSLTQPAIGMSGMMGGGMMSGGMMSGGMMGGGMMGGGMMGGGMGMAMLEADYKLFSINGRALGYGEPIRVRAGERVLLRVLNASATLTHRLALPGHRFTVVALDGNPVPTPQTVDAIELGVAERVDAVVEMTRPGVWMLGSTTDTFRTRGLGVVVEYAGQRGEPVWLAPAALVPWRYTNFGHRSSLPEPDGRFELVLRQAMGTQNSWTINGRTYADAMPLAVEHGKRYRLGFSNASMMEHPMHLHGHVFELAAIDGVRTSGVRKDVVVVRPMGQAEIDVLADNPGTFLLHCHNELHMGGGLATTLSYRHA